ncbi:hypothetical protein CVT26_010217 [Gymnopilus dilepis]|uniref:J domain-containing protein n=1 Tax=Gymnopilus dilepis TaxID=231916 RepID=A0A409Y180_9AGAR|nr:hypothetical protein CVT26_010217 [Gymnopilus dilepis]
MEAPTNPYFPMGKAVLLFYPAEEATTQIMTGGSSREADAKPGLDSEDVGGYYVLVYIKQARQGDLEEMVRFFRAQHEISRVVEKTIYAHILASLPEEVRIEGRDYVLKGKEEINPYELLDLKSEATDQEIRTAYRQRSLKVHPDRNPNNPDAARKFHELNQAYELLLDPLRRMALDAKLRVKQARVERFKSFDNKRKNMLNELEERERAFKKQRMDKAKEERDALAETERIKEEGKRLREQKEAEMRRRMMGEEEARRREEEEDVPPAMGRDSFFSFGCLCDTDKPLSQSDPLDTTVRIKYPLKSYPSLTTPSAISSFLSRFGSTDESSIVLNLSLKSKENGKEKTKALKTATALVPFKQIGDAFAAVCASGRKDLGLEGVKITWVGGKEPEILGWLRRMGKLGGVGAPAPSTAGKETSTPKAGDNDNVKTTLPQHQSRPSDPSTPFSTFPSTFAERERLEREILEAEAKQ